MNSKKRKIAIITGGRIEYGYIRPIIEEIKKRPNLDYEVIAANMHMLEEFGKTIEEIEKDNFKIGGRIRNTLAGFDHITMVKSLGVFMIQLPEILENMGADMILVAGDRGEPLVGAIVGGHMYIPVAHIQAGEVSGNIDGMTRHAITKFAHIHLAANQDAADRVLKMGEEEHRVFNVGAPMLDDLQEFLKQPKNEVYKKFELDSGQPVLMLVQHSVTEEFDKTEMHIKEIMEAVVELKLQTVIILNNSDAGCNIIRKNILDYKLPFLNIHQNVERKDYAGLMLIADVLVGNSSSGILESSTFKLPTVNIGNRQKGRLQSTNVINCDYNKKEILKSIKKAMTEEFKRISSESINPYGDGNSSGKVVDILESINIDDKLLAKAITY